MRVEPDQGAALVRYAREAIAEALGGPRARAPEGAWCERDGAVFVTLRHKNGDLHGCVGSLEPRRSLAVDVRENALASALEDPRAPAIELEDIGNLEVEVSVLSALERISAKDESEAVARIGGLRGGVVIRMRGRRATFLPQMWERIPDAKEFWLQLKRKAGIADDAWEQNTEVFHYTVQKFTE